MNDFGFFPSFYPDELAYSLFARYHIKSGNIHFSETSQELFGKVIINPELEFIDILTPTTRAYLTRNISMKQVVLEHTMFKQYARFQTDEKRNELYQLLYHTKGYYANAITINHKEENGTLKYCPICAKKDREIYGETYWHRIHQLRGLTICPVHFCKLHTSNVRLKKTEALQMIAAETEAVNEAVEMSTNETEIKLAQYLIAVFELPLDLENKTSVSQFLCSKIDNTQYIAKTGGTKKVALLYDDLREYYMGVNDNGLGISQRHHIEKLVDGYKKDFLSVCELALFLNISPEELCAMKLPDKTKQELFKEEVLALRGQGIGYNRIARMLGVSSATVRKALGVLPKYDYSKCNVKTKSGAIKQDYAKLDKELFPKVEKVINDCNNTGMQRPKRVSINAIQKLLGLAPKMFEKLPMCRELILSSMETQEEYWAREVAWAVDIVEQEGKELCITRIYDLTNINKRQLTSCLDKIKDKTLRTRLELLM